MIIKYSELLIKITKLNCGDLVISVNQIYQTHVTYVKLLLKIKLIIEQLVNLN